MSKNKKYWTLAVMGILSLFVCLIMSLVLFGQMSDEAVGEAGALVSKPTIFLVIEICAGYLSLAACFYILMRVRYSELFLENRNIRIAMEASCSLLIEYDMVKMQLAWYGDEDHIFQVKKRKLTPEEMVHPDDWPFVRQQYEDVKRGKVYSVEVRILDTAGKYRLCSCRMVPVKAPAGKLIRVVGIVHDVDAWFGKHAVSEKEEKLKENFPEESSI